MISPPSSATYLTCGAESACWGKEDVAQPSNGEMTVALVPAQSVTFGTAWPGVQNFLCTCSFYSPTTLETVAVKKMPKKLCRGTHNIMRNEAFMLYRAMHFKVPRVVKLVGDTSAPGGMKCLVLE